MIYLTHKMYLYSSTAGLIFANCLYMIVVFSIHIHRADGLSCYQCDSPDSIKNCPIVTCQQNEKCFVGSHQSSSGEKSYVYRCEAKLCNDQSVALIGRAVENATQPLEGAHCCDKDLCNGNVTECRDDPNIDCRALKDVVCPSLETASKLCRRTCNLCGSTSQLSTTMTSVQVSKTPLTTKQQQTKTTTAKQTTIPTPVHAHVTSGSVAVSPTTVSFWLPWSPYNCETVDGVCFGIRRRVCSTDVTLYDCPGLDYDSELCSDSLCHVTCEDEPGFNCDRIKDIACIDSDLVSMCNRTCGVCDTGEITTVTTTTTKTTTTAGTTTTQNSGQVTTGCQDLTGFNCEPIKDIVCIDPDLIHRCNKTCGVCDTGEATTKTTTTTTAAGRTTAQPSGQVTTGCQDLPGFNCEPIKDIVCNDPDLIHRCNKTCGLCDTGEATTKTTAAAGRTTTQPSGQVTTGCQDLPGFNCEPIKDIVCNDPDLIHRCNKTCGVCDTGEATTKTTTTTTTAAGRTTTQPSGQVTTGCQDLPGFNCEPVKDVVCNDPDLIHRCNKTCGVCGTCVDSRNCADPDIASLVCADPELAGRYCAKTCKLC